MGAIGEPLISGFVDSWLSHVLAYTLSFLILTYLTVVLGELVPKSIALEKAEALAVVLAVPLDMLGRIRHRSCGCSRRRRTRSRGCSGSRLRPLACTATPGRTSSTSSREAEDTGVIEEAEEEMLYKVFDFADKEVHEVMVPRPEVVALSVELPPEEASPR